MLAPLLLTALASVDAHAQDETATYTMTFEGLWTVDDITDAAMPSGAHFTQVIGATHSSDTTIWVSGGMASAGVEDVAELGIVSDLIGEIGQNANADAVVRAGSSFNRPTQTVSTTFAVKASHPLISVLSMIAPSPDWFVGVSSLSLYDNGWRNRVVDLYPYDAGTENGTGWSLFNPATSPQGVITSIRNTGRFHDNPIARLSFTSEQATDEETDEGTDTPGPHSADYTVPLLVAPDTTGGPQGMLRILNGTAESGTVEIHAVDDAGTRTGPATFTLNASAAAEFTATDLQSGNPSLGLTGGIGTGIGDARLLIDTDLQIVPLAFVRAADGTLSAMHDTVRAASEDGSGQYAYEVPVFNPSTEMVRASRLRLINPGDAGASVTIGARDDSGAAATGGDVTLTLAGGGARTLTAQQLEAGDADSITGRLGAGTGKWRLVVSSDQPLQVVNVVASTAGYWNNLSTTAAAGAAPADQAALNRRFVGESVVYETNTGRFTLEAMDGDRFTETGESDGAATSSTGSYGYEAVGPDAGRLTLTYDDGVGCLANFYFSTRTSGWFASHCTGGDDPDGFWLGGSWSVMDSEDSEGPGDSGGMTPVSPGDCYPGLLVRPGESCTYPGTADEFSVNARGRGSFLGRLAGIRIRFDNETVDGRVYDFLATHQGDGVWRIDRVAGSM
ncbi:MAG: spondin domain-containing protein [Rhodospirillaceae bacterium]|nr:spondin domain-containing protein [Rhodospirillaceae bacterium]MDE0000120.1 spondin domain-containing protein [Rhodospirillaceae bacterium]MDE0361295.1 spondin domain-containing protein [Rhodospirillaceae bacterium]